MKHTVAVLAFIFLVWTPAFAQQPVASTVPAGVELFVGAFHDGLNTDGYRLYVDGARVAEVPASQLKAGAIELDVPAGLALGDHVLEIRAFNKQGESAGNPTMSVKATPVIPPLKPPGAPSSIRVTVIGAVTIEVPR